MTHLIRGAVLTAVVALAAACSASATPPPAPAAQPAAPAGWSPAPVVPLASQPPPALVVDDAPWHWADASGEPLIIQALPPGPHKVWIGLADPTHKVLDSKTVSFVVPPGGGHH
ncbi:hypothetical protein H4696_008812 [Amycolatopsis lexingtonensis]|uniref:Uncharacterized protein n=2 Tax=Amycolatopsis lexingtonensis TaxID=218822 RepID=A0ABR9IFI5_9PSEU|nr:DUF6130 family protein [Amycolatopsis lexingtonensis]MBE1501712.1 hypothetical protein [Amycolatopsis lexingtonensis]